MRRRLLIATGVLLALASAGCGATSVGVGVRHGYYPGYYYGRGPFWGYGDRIIVVDPCAGDACGGIDPGPGGPEAVPLPEPPPDIPDMGMPDFGGMDMGGFDGGFDAGGFDF